MNFVFLHYCISVLFLPLRYTNAELTIRQFLRLHIIIIIIIILWRIHIKTPFTFWDMHTEEMWKVCLGTLRNNSICQKLAYFLRNFKTSRVNNSRILRIKNAKFSGYCFYMNANISWDFQICISIPLIFQKLINYTKSSSFHTAAVGLCYFVILHFSVKRGGVISIYNSELFETAQKMKFSITDFFSKWDKIRHLLKKSLKENFIFCVVWVHLFEVSIKACVINFCRNNCWNRTCRSKNCISETSWLYR